MKNVINLLRFEEIIIETKMIKMYTKLKKIVNLLPLIWESRELLEKVRVTSNIGNHIEVEYVNRYLYKGTCIACK